MTTPQRTVITFASMVGEAVVVSKPKFRDAVTVSTPRVCIRDGVQAANCSARFQKYARSSKTATNVRLAISV